ncbi:MAG: hypothetical protein ABI120_12805, partial [Gemmatimonadaceae bacterium]
DAIELERNVFNAGEASATIEPFQGLHVSGALEFDRWMSLERDRLRALLERQKISTVIAATTRSAVAPTAHQRHSHDASTLYLGGHYLFLRSAHGGSAEDLLRSKDYFERAHALDATFAAALAGLANFYAVAARRGVLKPFHEIFASAIDFSERAHAMDASLAVPHIHFAVKALYLDDDWDRAEREFGLAVQKEPNYAEGHRFYGVWLGLAGRHDEALREMDETARLEPDILHMLSSLAAARMAVGDNAGAEDALHKTLSIDALDAPARHRLVRLLEDEGRFEEAIAERTRAPSHPQAEDFRNAFMQARWFDSIAALTEARPNR